MKTKLLFLSFLLTLQMPFAFAQSQRIAIDYMVTVNTNFAIASTRSTHHLYILNHESIYFKDSKDSINQFINRDPNNTNTVQLGSRTLFKLSDNHYASFDMIQLYKNYEQDKLLLQEDLSGKSVVLQEDLTIFNWTILPNQDTLILGYPCKTATTDFRGRKYKAYFSPKLNNFGGPWKFEGLPGLILQVQSEDNYFVIEPIKIALNAQLEPIQNPYKDTKEEIIVGWEAFREAKINRLLTKYRAAVAKTGDLNFSINPNGDRIENIEIGIVDAKTIKAMEKAQKAKKKKKKNSTTF